MARGMTDRPLDPWREVPARRRLGANLRDLETRNPPVPARDTRRRRRQVTMSGGLAAALIAILVLVVTGRVADALSPINRAPAAAAASESVHFSSTIAIILGGQQHERFTEQGQIDFANGNFSTTLSVPQAGRTIERRIVGGVFYIAELPHALRTAKPVQWLALHLAGGQRASFSSAPEGDAFTDPPVLFRAMARNRARVTAVGHDDIGGMVTAHYRLFTDLARFLRASSSSGRSTASYRKVAATLDVWLDSRGRPRRVDEAFTGASSLGPARITTRIDFTGYGEPVTVRPPAKASVISQRRISTPGPLVADPSRLFERLLLTRP
jgi:hypothetical protein